MCIAILNTSGHTISKAHLRNCWENNTDGAGMLYINNDGKLETFKELTSFATFYKMYSYIKQEFGSRNIVLHFRISTHGRINETNCHPFLVNESVGFVHNGMIYDVPTNPDYSDTYMFNELYLKMFKDGFEQNDFTLEMIQSYIGLGNKLIFLNDKNEFSIVNESKGHWFNGSWFSNYSYEKVNSWVDYGGVKKYKSGLGTTTSSGVKWNDPFKDDEGFDWDKMRDSNRQYCKCGVTLYGEHELAKEMCHWCQEDEANGIVTDISASASDSSSGWCDCCDTHGKVTYHNAWHSNLCDKCEDELQREGYLGA
jgi:predicted glutamine amidotransferase